MSYISWPEYMKLVNKQRRYNEEQRFYGKLRKDMKKRLSVQKYKSKNKLPQ